MAREGGRAERAALVHQALGEVVQAVARRLLALLGLAGHLAVARLDAFFLHGQGSVDLRWSGREGQQVRSDTTSNVSHVLFWMFAKRH